MCRLARGMWTGSPVVKQDLTLDEASEDKGTPLSSGGFSEPLRGLGQMCTASAKLRKVSRGKGSSASPHLQKLGGSVQEPAVTSHVQPVTG